ncbi:MAG: glutamine--fructose-6-phosphate transaminase (isomerizing) [Lachnospiraceae bacterium]|jgi:glucosamine--fructose-6-phosphate aminotransferase (isomerizing)|nr:glutamine--fructose-6-phosphate transaminase (isomerizing) [Lachnospiraceae bacterium]
MCGIIGYIGKEKAVPVLVEGLKRLEYRGYDSAGVAVLSGEEFSVVKRKGRLAALEAALNEAPIDGQLGIGHTRWATHGEPSDVNSHPHLGHRSKVAVVHNGIIENYKEIKEFLEKKGVKFASQTDSEVVAQLFEYYYKGGVMETIARVTRYLEGSYALGIMCLDKPDMLIAVKKDNPLIVGVAEHGNFIASDVPAILSHTDKVYYPEDMEIVVLKKDEVEFYNCDYEQINKEPVTITWSLDSAEKGGYQHFMLKEIMEQPRVLRDTIVSATDTVANENNKKVIDNLDISRFNRIVVAACGSAYNAGFVAKYVFERLCGLAVEVDLASEFRYRDASIDEKTLVLLISQSGETADTIAALREAKKKGAVTMAIVNVIGSTIAKEAEFCAYTVAGPEIAVATTKAFSAQLALLYVLAIRFAAGLGKVTADKEKELIAELLALPEKVTALLEQIDLIQKYASTCVGYKSIFFIGRNIDYAIALEGSLKLKEISYIHSEAYAGGELKHGPISLIEENTLVVALANCGYLHSKIMSNVEQVISRGAKVMLIGNCGQGSDEDKITQISIPEVADVFSPSLTVVVLQLFSYYIAANKGLDIDKPRNLAKSVTVE